LTLSNLGRLAEAAEDGRRSLELARGLGYPAGEALALADLSIAAHYIGDLDNSVRLARQAEQIPADIPGWITRLCTYVLALVLIASGDLAAAERSCTAGLAQSRDTGDLRNYTRLLVLMAWLDLQAGRTEDAPVHLHESLETAVRTGRWVHVVHGLVCCGYLCAATGRATEAATVWAAAMTLAPQGGFTDTGASRVSCTPGFV